MLCLSHSPSTSPFNKEFLNGERYTKKTKKKYAKYLKYLEDEHEFDDIPF